MQILLKDTSILYAIIEYEKESEAEKALGRYI